jgi:S1-C subfamily serine protease
MKVGVGWIGALCGTLLLPALAVAEPIAGSAVQVGAWRVAAYTRGSSNAFDHCTTYRVQGDGVVLALRHNAQGVWTMSADAPDWGLARQGSYTATLQVGGASYTATGHAFDSRAMTFTVAPEIYGQLKSGRQLVISANHKRYTVSLDGVEAASQRARDCVRHYAGGTAAPSMPPPTPVQGSGGASASPSQLVATIQQLLTRLGYDPGPANGQVGLKTNMAISAFQKSIGERGDGQPSDALRGQLEKAAAQRTASAAPPASVPAPPPRPTPRPDGARKRELEGAGTGFFIAPDTVVTNFHVINGCSELRLRKAGADGGAVSVQATSRADDLAALRVEKPAKNFLKLRVGAPIKPAEPVLVFGYPLSEALSSAGNTTLGNVTALAGLRDDSRYIQISAAVQPGNSGGPAVDEAGRLMGVVVAKLNALAIARITGDIPQNVNFAIKVGTLVGFLEANKIAYEPADPAARELPVTQRAERAEAASTQVECWK